MCSCTGGGAFQFSVFFRVYPLKFTARKCASAFNDADSSSQAPAQSCAYDTLQAQNKTKQNNKLILMRPSPRASAVGEPPSLSPVVSSPRRYSPEAACPRRHGCAAKPTLKALMVTFRSIRQGVICPAPGRGKCGTSAFAYCSLDWAPHARGLTLPLWEASICCGLSRVRGCSAILARKSISVCIWVLGCCPGSEQAGTRYFLRDVSVPSSCPHQALDGLWHHQTATSPDLDIDAGSFADDLITTCQLSPDAFHIPLPAATLYSPSMEGLACMSISQELRHRELPHRIARTPH